MKKITYLILLVILFSCKKEVIQFSLTTSSNPLNAGSVSPSSGSFDMGQQVSINATPAGEYVFKNWEGGLTGTQNPGTITMDGAKSIQANFEKRPYPLNLSVEGSGTVKEEVIQVATNANYPSGTRVRLTAVPLPMWSFREWLGDQPSKDSSIVVEMLGSKTIKAVFKEYPLIPALNRDQFPNTEFSYKLSPPDFNKDGVPDIATQTDDRASIAPPIFKINDYSGKNIYSFDLKQFNPKVRDSLRSIMFDHLDINYDGYDDFVLSYMGEWQVNPKDPGTWKYIKNYVILLLSKGKFEYDVSEVWDNNTLPVQFNVGIFDWDLDGQQDVLVSGFERGVYLKNLGKNKFEIRKLNPLPFNEGAGMVLDFDKDGKWDYVNIYVNQINENNEYQKKDMSQTLSVMSGNGSIKHFPIQGKTITKYIYYNFAPDVVSFERSNMVDGDGDGDLDLVLGSVRVKPNAPWYYIQEYFENKGTHFQFVPNFIEIDDDLIGDWNVFTKDIDQDGDADLYIPSYRKSQLNAPRGKYFWWENTGKGFKINKKFRLGY